MGWPRRTFVGKSRQWSVMDALARGIGCAERAIERLERTGGSERAKDRRRRQVARMRAMRAAIIENDWAELLR